jgi:2-isopropylmalate synthase
MEILEATIDAGATVLNIPDTTGYTVPEIWGALIRRITTSVRGVQNVVVSVHCHNDLGMAVANTLAGVKNGARQVECTINGIGERAGNAALEEVVMILKTRRDFYAAHTGIDTTQIIPTSRLVSELMNIPVQPNKAITGGNAFRHSSGIHQDGILKDRANYEIISPREVGAGDHAFVLTARSGRHALRHCLKELGFEFSDREFSALHRRFLRLADTRKQVSNEDLLELVRS